MYATSGKARKRGMRGWRWKTLSAAKDKYGRAERTVKSCDYPIVEALCYAKNMPLSRQYSIE